MELTFPYRLLSFLIFHLITTNVIFVSELTHGLPISSSNQTGTVEVDKESFKTCLKSIWGQPIALDDVDSCSGASAKSSNICKVIYSLSLDICRGGKDGSISPKFLKKILRAVDLDSSNSKLNCSDFKNYLELSSLKSTDILKTIKVEDCEKDCPSSGVGDQEETDNWDYCHAFSKVLAIKKKLPENYVGAGTRTSSKIKTSKDKDDEGQGEPSKISPAPDGDDQEQDLKVKKQKKKTQSQEIDVNDDDTKIPVELTETTDHSDANTNTKVKKTDDADDLKADHDEDTDNKKTLEKPEIKDKDSDSGSRKVTTTSTVKSNKVQGGDEFEKPEPAPAPESKAGSPNDDEENKKEKSIKTQDNDDVDKHEDESNKKSQFKIPKKTKSNPNAKDNENSAENELEGGIPDPDGLEDDRDTDPEADGKALDEKEERQGQKSKSSKKELENTKSQSSNGSKKDKSGKTKSGDKSDDSYDNEIQKPFDSSLPYELGEEPGNYNYFLLFVLICCIGFFGFLNKKRIIACFLEGRRPRASRSRSRSNSATRNGSGAGGATYSKLENNYDD